MKKLFFITAFLCYFLLGSDIRSFAREFESEIENSIQSKTNRYIKNVYDKIKFGKFSKLSFEAFKYGFYGYLNMVEAGKINPGSLLTICDFTLSSNLKRMWVIDPKNYKVLFNTLVAHGMGTGEEFATAFSNTEDSHQSSLGFYVTGETYDGNNGYSLKLNGVDGLFNSKAYDRAIVIHGAEYVSDEFARGNKRIGRSHGCPALPVDIAPKIIDKVKNGTCLFIYHSSKNYLTSSYWLRNKIKQLPEDADRLELMAGNYNNPRFVESNKGNNESVPAETQEALNDHPSSPATSSAKKDATTGKTSISTQQNVCNEAPANKQITSIVVIDQTAGGEVIKTTVIK